MNAENPTEESHRARSDFIRELVQRSSYSDTLSSSCAKKLPRRVIQFWNDLSRLPIDVHKCIETWSKVEVLGIERLLYDSHQAREFIRRKLGARYKNAYDKCYHPAMQSDYFRLCYIFVEGGCYIDVDDVYNGNQVQHLFNDCKLKIQPLCYDMQTNMMVPPSVFMKPGANVASWIFYFNNNPLIAGRRHPLICHALDQATRYLEQDMTNGLPEIQSTTGPGNLTKSIFDVVNDSSELEETIFVLRDWEKIAKTVWDLSYRNDPRNWRLSNCLKYQG
ncbi:MAG: glycosyltransferase [Desulfobacter sp.]